MGSALQPPTVHFAAEHGKHRNGPEHPESPARLDTVCVPAVKALGGGVRWEDVGRRADAQAAVLRVHDAAHVDRVRRAPAWGLLELGPDTFVRRGSLEALLAAQSTWLDAVDAALSGRTSSSWALSRPPGHHAGRASADGFCVFNFVAGAAAYALDVRNLSSVAIVDWDVHHGNGVAAYVDEEPRASYASVHQAPLWPGTGDDPADRGPLENRFSAPVGRGANRDAYVAAWRTCLEFAAASRPELVLVSAGFDALRSDPLAQCSLSPADFRDLSAMVGETFNNDDQNVPVVFGLEGGYSPEMGEALARSLEPWVFASPPPLSHEQSRAEIALCRADELPERGTARRIGDACVCVDATGTPSVVCDRLPPFGLETLDFGDFDPHVRVFADRCTGTKFYAETGDVRGAWCSSKKRWWLRFLRPEKEPLVVARCRIRGDHLLVDELDLDRVKAASRRLQARDRPAFLLAGVPSRAYIDTLARTAPLEIRTVAANGEVRSSCYARDDPGVELGSYLVRTPKPGDPPTPATDALIADLLHAGDFAAINKSPADASAKVAAGVAVFVEPAARGRKIGDLLFKQAMRACRLLGFNYMLFIERDSGSGRLVKWYEAMGFVKVPPDALPGLDRAMIGELPDPVLGAAFYDSHQTQKDDVRVLPFS
ncbi:hypothetical protein CTAYLR_002750 [Chrysophaeum taylorii]|uniref:Histone deacetylase n=1 Tax=Chrysophaeum taylorii TaxID=2483200 RepID=A0AAD7UC22_9STRA|nr:hypothetical protein CTAYLR_002750 [Chrysophaeum taylorii]